MAEIRKKYGQYFAIESGLIADGIPVDRSILVQEFSKGVFHGLSDLNEWQLKEFYRWLNTKAVNLRKEHNVLDKNNQMRRKIIAIAHKMNWKLPNGNIDLQRLDDWCIKSGEFNKSLNQHRYKELVKLCSQIELVYKTFLPKL